MVENALLSFLSRDWAGLVGAAATALVGAVCVGVGRATAVPWAVVFGWAVLGVAALAAVGSLRHLVHMAMVRSQNPPPGRLIDVGGYRVHVLAEGDAKGRPPVVWMPGAHSGGFAYHHLHSALRDEARSILIDRPGTGWSDIGPFPRTTAREAQEVIAALDGNGEKGPFVLVGHSFGGPLVANIARRWPERVAALVMVDATPPDTIVYGPPIPILKQMRKGAVLNVLPRLFGIHVDFAERKMRRDAPADWKRIGDIVDERLGEAGRTLRAIESGTRSACAGASIYSELSPVGLAEVAWETVVYEGDLGNMTVLLVAPQGMEEEEFQATVQMIDRLSGLDEPVDQVRLRRFYDRSRERYLTISSQSRRVYAPEGTGHNFPYETPDFLLGVVRSLLEPGSPPEAGSAAS